MKTINQDLQDYLESIKSKITIDIPKVSGIQPYISNQEFKYLSIIHRSSEWAISTQGRQHSSLSTESLISELMEANVIIKNLNKLMY